MAKVRKQSAKLEQVLFYLEGPQIICLHTAQKRKIIAVATDNISRHAFFGAEVNARQFEGYLDQRYDLRHLLLNPSSDKWFEFDLSEDEDEVLKLESIELTKKHIKDIVPDHGFFARDHTSVYQRANEVVRPVQRFLVDGNWDMREFSKFHSYISDLYALTKSVDIFLSDDQDIEEKRKVVKSFIKPWEGGGSYYGFFRSLAKAGGRLFRPDIRAIQWASPGYIDVLGEAASFERMVRLIDHYGENERAIIKQYDHLWSYLQQEGLLKQNTSRMDRSSDAAKEVTQRARELSSALSMVQYRSLKTMAGGDPVVAAKVLLASKRRLQKLYEFFSEGRVAVSGAEIG
ncbi:hypothetical protein [Parasphingorhabdus flavimaris]|uniref:hypothetical protein n=1 Tax=Parasphingorhabdus flavimaris TaxID=266812 RepID=UPI0030017D92